MSLIRVWNVFCSCISSHWSFTGLGLNLVSVLKTMTRYWLSLLIESAPRTALLSHPALVSSLACHTLSLLYFITPSSAKLCIRLSIRLSAPFSLTSGNCERRRQHQNREETNRKSETRVKG